MSGLTQILEIARRALAAQQSGINVTSHNIANAGTAGYSRQQVNLVATNPLPSPGGLLGTGVAVSHIGRIRERFIDQQIRLSSNSYGSATAEQRVLSQVEAALNEPSEGGLGSVMAKFFTSFQDLSVHPEESAPRTAVVQKGDMLAQTFRRLTSSLQQLKSDVGDDANLMVDRINALARDISGLDVQIVATRSQGGEPSDLQDQRDMKIDELSQLANINVAEDELGSVLVSVGGTVIASRSGPVALAVTSAGGELRITQKESGAPVSAIGGEIGGLLTTANGDIPSALAKLDQLAGAIITRVNTLHSAGFGLGSPAPTGINFFTGTTAADIGVDPAVKNNSNNVAASGTGAPGNNDVALALSRVGNEPLLSGNSLSVTQAYGNLVSGIGSRIGGTEATVSAQELILGQLDNQRNAVSGVSLDEEMTNLIKFQRSYEAAARVVNTVNELFQSILNMV
jgi:flagellar hook-associated protein 1 FlgK